MSVEGQFVHFIQIKTPLDPRDAVRELRSLAPGQSMADLFPEVMGEAEPLAYTLNARVIERNEFATTFPEPGDYITRCPVPQGGGGGGGAKTVLRLVAMIVIAIYAPQIAGAMAFEAGMSGMIPIAMMETAQTAITAGIMIGGSVMVNSMLPPPELKTGGGPESSPSYGIDGAKNTSAEGVVVPVTYGQFRMGGNFIGNYVENDGDTQWLFLLLNAGEGEVAAIGRDSLLINDQALNTFDQEKLKPEIIFRPGTADQEPQPWFQSAVKPQLVNKKTITTFVTAITDEVVDRLRLDFLAPGGIYNYDASENFTSRAQVTLVAQYRRYIDGQPPEQGWVNFQSLDTVIDYVEERVFFPVKVLDEQGNVVGERPYVPNPDVSSFDLNGLIYENTYRSGPDGESIAYTPVVGEIRKRPIYGTATELFMFGSSRTAVRRSYYSPNLTAGRYEVRFRRTSEEDTSTNPSRVDTIYVTDLVGIIDDKVAHRHTATLALKLRLSDQLNGMPSVTYVTGGKIIDCFDSKERVWKRIPSANPAWICYDILSNPRYGGGAPFSRFDIDAWIDWADYCDANALTFHGIFDTQSNVWDAANQVARCGHGQVVQMGSKFSCVVERPTAPTMMFNMGNIIQGTFKETWLPLADRANEIEISYFDRLDGYIRKTLRVIDEQAQVAGRAARKSSIEMMGIVDAQRAYDEAWFALKLNRYILRTVTFSAPIESIACLPGDVILVQHDMPQWGYGGRLAEDSPGTMSLKLDQKVTLEHDKTYQVLVHADVAQLHSGLITAVTGDFITVSSLHGSLKATRAVFGGKDHEILSYHEYMGAWGVLVGSAHGAQVGSTITLYQVNAIVTRTVSNPAAGTGGFVETDTLTFMQALDFAPKQFTKWMFGPTDRVAKPFRVRKITGSHNLQRDITAIEYSEAIYSREGLVPDINYSLLDQIQVKQVVIDKVYEEVQLIGGTYQSVVTVSYRGQQDLYKEAEVYVSRNDGPFVSVGRDRGSVSVGAVPGDTLAFKVVAINQAGKSANLTSAPRETIIVRGRTTHQISVPTGIQAAFTNTGLLVTWTVPPEPDWTQTNIRAGLTRPAAVLQFSGKAQRIELPFVSSPGSFYLFVSHSIPGRESEDAPVAINVQRPGTAQPAAATTAAGLATITWTSCRTTQPIARHIVKIGAVGQDYDVLPVATTLSGSGMVYTPAFAASGIYRVWVVAVDAGGIEGVPNYVDVTINLSNVSGVSMSASTQLIKTDSDGFNPNPAQVTFDAYPSGPAGAAPAVWETVPAGLTLVGTGNSRVLTYENMQGHESVQVRVSYNDGSVTVSDAITVVRISDGKSALVGFLTNENVTLTAANNGIIPQANLLAAAQGQFRVFVGQTEVDPFSVEWQMFGTNDTRYEVSLDGFYKVTEDLSASTLPRVYRLLATYQGVTIERQFSLNKLAPAPKGDTGPAGRRTAQARVYKTALSIPTPATGVSTYDWATGKVDVPPSFWSIDPPNPAPGWTLYALTVQLSNFATTATDPVDWSTGGITAIATSGTGQQGIQGLSAMMAYTKLPAATTLDVGPRETWGKALPWVGSYGQMETWQASSPVIGINETAWQVNGIYNPATDKTTWDTPYVSALKVGALSAISANLGFITGGSLDIGNGRFLVDSNGYATIRGLRVLDESGNVVISTKTGTTAALPSSWITPAAGWLNSNVNLPGLGLRTFVVQNYGWAGQHPRWYGGGLRDVDAGHTLIGHEGRRSYVVVELHKTTLALVFSQTYDVAGNGETASPDGYFRAAASMAADLNYIADNRPGNIIVVFTHDEPFANRMTAGLPEAMYRCGASRGVFGSPNFPYRGAYILVGRAGIGEGCGVESLAPVGGVAGSWAELSFTVRAGTMTVTGGSTPRTISDYGYSGDLDATKGASWNTNIVGQPANSSIFNSQIGVNSDGLFYNTTMGMANIPVSNNRITVSNSGNAYAINGIGSVGSINLGGMGYTGALDATNGATMGVNVGGTVSPQLAATMFVDGVFAARHIATPSLSAISANMGAITAGSITAGFYQSDVPGTRRVTINENNDVRVYSNLAGSNLQIAQIGESYDSGFGMYAAARFGDAGWVHAGLIVRSGGHGAIILTGNSPAIYASSSSNLAAVFYGSAGKGSIALSRNDVTEPNYATGNAGFITLGVSTASGGRVTIGNRDRVGTLLDTNHITITSSSGMPSGGSDGDIVIVV